MTRKRNPAPSMAATAEGDGPTGQMTVPVMGAFQPVRSRWTWQPRLPELWLREHEGRQFRELVSRLKKEG